MAAGLEPPQAVVQYVILIGRWRILRCTIHFADFSLKLTLVLMYHKDSLEISACFYCTWFCIRSDFIVVISALELGLHDSTVCRVLTGEF